MDFNIDYTLPHFNEIYTDVNYNTICSEYPYNVLKRESPTDVNVNYMLFMRFVNYITYGDTYNKEHSSICRKLFNNFENIQKFDDVDSVKLWLRDIDYSPADIPTMKLMLIMKCFEDLNLSHDVAEYCKKYGRESFIKYQYPCKYSTKYVIAMNAVNNSNKFNTNMLGALQLAILPNMRFEYLTGYTLNKTNLDGYMPFKLIQKQFCKKYVPLRKKGLFTLLLNHTPGLIDESNIPYILYNTICRCVVDEEHNHRVVKNLNNNAFCCWFYHTMKYTYGAVKVCYLYGKSDHTQFNYLSSYYNFVYHTIFKLFAETYGYLYSDDDMSITSKQFDDFIYTNEIDTLISNNM